MIDVRLSADVVLDLVRSQVRCCVKTALGQLTSVSERHGSTRPCIEFRQPVVKLAFGGVNLP